MGAKKKLSSKISPHSKIIPHFLHSSASSGGDSSASRNSSSDSDSDGKSSRSEGDSLKRNKTTAGKKGKKAVAAKSHLQRDR